MVSEEQAYRDPLPDWVLKVDQIELEIYIEDGITMAIREHRATIEEA